MLSPGRMSPSLKKTEGPLSLSTWPSMIAGPGCPGVGDSSNQAASFRCGPGWGTAREPSSASPSSLTRESTPIAGMRIPTGLEAPNGSCALSAGSTDGVGLAAADRLLDGHCVLD